jgi:hypothetical protein
MTSLDQPISQAPTTGLHYATRKGQDDLRIYTMVLPLGVLARDVVRDFSPEEPLPGNRRVDAKRALEYADYVIERHKDGRAHITPPVVLRGSNGEVREFGEWIKEDAQGISRGALVIEPRSLRTADGQHRIYGGKKKLEWYDDEIIKQKLVVEHAEVNEQEPEIIKQAQQRLERLREEREALYRLPVTAEIISVESERVYQQLFADMANNAKGLGGDLTTWFDQTRVAYRVARTLVEEGGHPLLVDKVHIGVGTEDRLASDGPYWVGAKTVADVVHSVARGVSGRFSRKEEKQFEQDLQAEKDLKTETERFLDCLAEAFPVMREIKTSQPTRAGEIRKSKRTMLTSSSMLRALAGAYYLNVVAATIPVPGEDSETRAKSFVKGIATLTDSLAVDPKTGLQQTNLIVKLSPSSFAFGGTSKPTAPTARMGNITSLANGIAEHVRRVTKG